MTNFLFVNNIKELYRAIKIDSNMKISDKYFHQK